MRGFTRLKMNGFNQIQFELSSLVKKQSNLRCAPAEVLNCWLFRRHAVRGRTVSRNIKKTDDATKFMNWTSFFPFFTLQYSSLITYRYRVWRRALFSRIKRYWTAFPELYVVAFLFAVPVATNSMICEFLKRWVAFQAHKTSNLFDLRPSFFRSFELFLLVSHNLKLMIVQICLADY